MFLLDVVWFAGAAHLFPYRPHIGRHMVERFALGPALVFHAIYLGAMVAFVVVPAVTRRRWQSALWQGALVGLLAHAAYDLTNPMTLTRWPWLLTLMDLAWGAFLAALASAVGCLAAMAIEPGRRRDA